MAVALCGVLTTSAQAAVGGGGGPTNTATTSTTRHDTHTRVDIADAHTYQTRVLGYIYDNQGHTAWVYNAATPAGPSPAGQNEINSLFEGARDAIRAAAHDEDIMPGRCAALNIGNPTFLGSSESRSAAVKVGEQFDRAETSVTTTTTFGPATILIGENQSQSFFVAAGSVNINTNTHTENFINDLYQATVNHEDTYQIIGRKTVSPLILDLAGTGKIQASDGLYLPHPGEFHYKHRVLFDFFGNGFPVAMEWVGPQDGLLVMPKEDGSIDGTCLFGTASGYETGFEQLASLDANLDYKVAGAELAGLKVWQDKNGNARGDQGELTSVQDLGITELSVRNSKMVGSYKMKGNTYKMFDWWPTVMQVKKVNWKPSV